MDINCNTTFKQETNLTDHEPAVITSVERSGTSLLKVQDMVPVLDKIEKLLEPIYGIQANRMLIIQPTMSEIKTYNRFTSDGINVLKAVKWDNKLDAFVANLIISIGERVEKIAGDGTTTAMLFTVKLFKLLIADKDDKVTNIDSFVLSDQLSNILTSLIEKIESHTNSKITNAVLSKIILQITKEDNELQEKVLEILNMLPTELLPVFQYVKNPVETKKRFWVEQSDYQFGFDTPRTNLTQDTHKVKLFFPNINEMIKDIHKFNNEIMTPLNKTIDNLVCLLPANLPSIILETITANYKFIFIDDAFQSSEYELFHIVKALAGIDKNTNGYKEVELTYSYVSIFINDGLYPETEIGQPYFPNESNIAYNELKDKFLNELETIRQSHTGVALNEKYNKVMYYLRNLLFYKMPLLYVGGTTTDVLESIDKIEDIKGALVSLNKSGWIRNPEPLLRNEITKILESYPDNKLTLLEGVQIKIYEKINTILKQFLTTLIKQQETLKYYKYLPFSEKLESYQITGVWLETLKRAKEVIPRLLRVDTIIVDEGKLFGT